MCETRKKNQNILQGFGPGAYACQNVIPGQDGSGTTQTLAEDDTDTISPIGEPPEDLAEATAVETAHVVPVAVPVLVDKEGPLPELLEHGSCPCVIRTMTLILLAVALANIIVWVLLGA